MPKQHLSVREAIVHYATQQNWNVDSVSELTIQYIEEHCSSEDFAEFLKNKAGEENDSL